MSAGFVLTGEEMEALSGIPDQDFRMYVLMRFWMNYSTGLVGDPRDRLVSYRRLREHMEVVPERGSKLAPTRRTDDALRASVARLVRRGLLVAAGEAFSFCYLLPMALVRSNEEPRVNPASEPPMSPTGFGLDFQGGEHGLQGYEPRAVLPDEPQPSVYLSDGDERGAGAGNFGEEWVASAGGVGSADGDGAAMGSTVDFRRALGAEGVPSAGLQKACVTLAGVLRRRGVTVGEMRMAVAIAREKRAGSVAAYAASVIASDSLLAAPGGASKVVRFGPRASRGGVDAVLAAAAEAMGYGG